VNWNTFWTLITAATAMSYSGCGSDDGNLPRTVPASGVVTLDGKPVDGAQVILIAEGSGTSAYGSTDSQGRFSLRISDKKSGAVPGSYKVQVSKTIEKKLTGTLDGGDAVSFEYGLPAKYTGHLTSGLTAQIPDSGTDAIKFELTSK
jgi:hypothetical protein